MADKTLEQKVENSIYWINWLREEMKCYKEKISNSVGKAQEKIKQGLDKDKILEDFIQDIGQSSNPYFMPSEEKIKQFEIDAKTGLI